MPPNDLDTDLLLLSRQHALGARDRERLQRQLEASQEVRVSRDVLEALDADAQVQSGDDARLQRLVDEAIRPTPRLRLTRRPQQIVLVAALVIGSAGLAAANSQLGPTIRDFGRVLDKVFGGGEQASRPPNIPPSERQPQIGHTAAASAAPDARLEASETAEKVEQDAAEASETQANAEAITKAAQPAPTPASAAPTNDPSPKAPTTNRQGPTQSKSAFPLDTKAAGAAGMFAEANRARRNGRTSHAKALYEQLVQRHPGAGESAMAMLTLGRLELSSGRAQQALTWFRRYQRRGATLMLAEALLGEREALIALGRAQQAKAVTERLCKAYPTARYPVCYNTSQ